MAESLASATPVLRSPYDDGLIKIYTKQIEQRPLIVAFHYFAEHGEELYYYKWLHLLRELAWEYDGRITFCVADISTIGDFNDKLSVFDFGSYRALVPPRVYAVDEDNRQYANHMFFKLKYLTDFCEKLLKGEMFSCSLVTATRIMPAHNYYRISESRTADFLVVLYDPACYYWTLQRGMLRKLARLLSGESVYIFIINKAHNYLGACFGHGQAGLEYYGSTSMLLPAKDEKESTCVPFHGILSGTRAFLRYIAATRPIELKNYDRTGELRAPMEALRDIRYLYDDVFPFAIGVSSQN